MCHLPEVTRSAETYAVPSARSDQKSETGIVLERPPSEVGIRWLFGMVQLRSNRSFC